MPGAGGGTTRAGFTYVEVIVALMIFAVGVLPIVMFFTSTTSEISGTIDNVLMASYANELLDAIISNPFDQVPANLEAEIGPTTSDPFLSKLVPMLSQTGEVYKRRVGIKTDTIHFAPDLVAEMDEYTKARFDRICTFKIVKVTVDFAPGGGRPKSLDICTILTAE